MGSMPRRGPGPWSGTPRAGTIALVFLLVSVPYILTSDRLLLAWVSDAAALTAWQTVKGWAYVFAAAGLVFLLELRIVRRHRRALAAQRRAYDATIDGWARALELRDHDTEGHGRRVSELARRLGARLGLGPAELQALRHGALLHDVGKIGVRDDVLRQPGPLDAARWTEMRGHPLLGHELLADVPGLTAAADVVRSHHERWDGGGYPDGLAGDAIPRLARLFTVVDVYDALRTDRPYRAAWPEAAVREHLRHERGHEFDPRAVDAFLALLAEEDAAALSPGSAAPR